MSKIRLTDSFNRIPEGEYIFYIYAVDYNEEFGRMAISLITADGKKHTERFYMKDMSGNPVDRAMSNFSYLAKCALNDFDVEEIDHTDIIGHYFKATVAYDVRPDKNDPTKTKTYTNLTEKTPADGFDTEPIDSVKEIIGANAPKTASEATYTASDVDLDSLLG